MVLPQLPLYGVVERLDVVVEPVGVPLHLIDDELQLALLSLLLLPQPLQLLLLQPPLPLLLPLLVDQPLDLLPLLILAGLKLLPLLLPPILDILDDISILLLGLHDLLVQPFDGRVRDLVLDVELGELLVEEADVGLVLVGHDLLLGLDLMEGLMQILHLIILHSRGLIDPFRQVLNPDVPLFQPLPQLSLHPLILPLLPIHNPILLLELPLHLLQLLPQLLNNR